MCTYVIFPQTRDGPLIGKCMDDAEEWRQVWESSESSNKSPSLQCPDNMIYAEGVGGGVYEYELESEEICVRPGLDKDAGLDAIERYSKKYAHFLSSPGHGGYIDLRTGETMMQERSLDDVDVWRPDDGIAYDTYGGCRSPKLRRLCDQDSPLFTYHEKRMAATAQVIDRHRDQLGVDVMWQVLLGRTPGGELCQHADTRPPNIHFITMWVTLLAPALGRFWTRCVSGGKAPDEVDAVEQQFKPWL